MKRLAYSCAVLAGVALAVLTGPARPQTVLAQGPTLTCTAPNPVDRFPAAHKYFMVIVDSSGSMTTPVAAAVDSCGYKSLGGSYAARIDHARCAVDHIVSQFNGTVDFGIAQYAMKTSSGSATCYASWSSTCYPQEPSTVGTCTGCGPRPGDYTTRAGARILAPVNSTPSTILQWVDNNCTGAVEVGQAGNTPLNGALRDMKRYFQAGWTAPDSSVSYPTPLTGNSCSGRSINVLLVTDGDETCDTTPAGAAAAVAQDLYVNGVTVGGVNYKVKTYVVNFAGGNQVVTDQIAAAGGTGASYFATNEAQLLAAMQQIMAAPAEVYGNNADDDCNSCIDDGWSNLSLTGSATPAVAGQGESVTYTFVAQNTGPTDADARVQIISASYAGAFSSVPSLVGPAGWTCSGNACTNPDFAVGDSATFTLTGSISATAIDGWTPTYTLEISPIQYVQDPSSADNGASASITVHVKATPTITWPTPADIVYGTALSSAQLNATASTTGNFSYNPASGTVLDAGTHALLVDFTPDLPDDFNSASASVSINVLRAAPTVSVTGGTFTYDGSAHPATASATGVGGASLTPVAITYNGSSTEPVNAGTYAVLAEFAGDSNYESASATAAITINKAAPTITWPAPSAITYGTALGGTQLNATASVSGSFAYSPAAGAVLNAGTGQALSATFTPDDTTNYDGASASVTIDVLKATPTVSVTGGTFTYDGSAHPATASATGVGEASLTPVSITYNGGSSEPVTAGTYAVEASFAGDTNYEPASATATITINKAASTITWPAPSAITYGTPLGGTQLNATASVPGAFAYTPASGTVLSAGSGQTLSVAFTPTDSTNYASATASVSIDVLKATPTVSVTGGTFTYDGSAHPAAASAAGVGGASLTPVTVTYNGSASAPVNAGTYAVVASFAGDGNYEPASATATITINPAASVLSWPTPAAITFGTPLSGAQLNATANVPGTFVYTPPAGTVLPIGTHTLSVAFTPADPVNYTPASATVSLDVIFGFCLSYDASQAKQAGSTIPLKIRLCDANGQAIPMADLVLTAQSVISGSTGATQPPQDAGNANPGGVFRIVGDGYMFNLQTARDMAGPYTLTFTVGTDPRLYNLPFMVRAR